MKQFFSVLEISELLKISRSTVLYYIKSGKLNATQVGKVYIITWEDFGEFLKTNKLKRKKNKIDQTLFDF